MFAAFLGPFHVSLRAYSDEARKSEMVFKKKLQQNEAEFQKGLPEWKKRQFSLEKRYNSWNPTKKLSRQQIQDLRNLKDQAPHMKTVELANYFDVSPEAVRRILRSKWVPKEEEMEDLLERAERRKNASKEARRGALSDIQAKRDRLALNRGVNMGAIPTLKPEMATKQPFSRRSRGPKKGPPPARRNTQKAFVDSVGDLLD